MAVLATFDPGNDSYGRSANALFSGMNQGLSMMERKQGLALSQQQADQQRMEFIAKLPLIEAQATLTRVNAAAAVKNATDIAQSEARAALESVTANKEFMDAQRFTVGGPHLDQDGDPTGSDEIDTQKTWEERATKLAALRVKYGYMANLKGGYGAFYDTLTKSWVQANENAHINLKADEALSIANTRAETARHASEMGVVKENIKATAKGASATTYTQSRERIAQINNDAKLTAQDKAGQIAATKEGATIVNLSNLANEADQRAAEAFAEGDDLLMKRHLETARSLREDMKRISTHPGVESSAPEKTPPPLAKTPTEDIATRAEQKAAQEVAPTPTQAADKPETSHPSPVKVTAWSQAKSLKPGTKYIGPDGVLYTRGQ